MNLGFNAHSFAVNGIMTGDSIYSMDCDVAAGRKANTILTIKNTFLEENLIAYIKYIDILLWAYDNDKHFKEFESDEIRITMNDSEIIPDIIDGTNIYNKDGIKVDFISSADNSFKYVITNNTGNYFDFSVNNITVNEYTSSELDFDLNDVQVLNGCQKVFNIGLSKEFNDINDIQDISIIEFSLEIEPLGTYLDKFSSDVIESRH